MKSHLLPARTYSLVLGLAGIGALFWLTDAQALRTNAVPLALFAALSFFTKRAGFHIAPQVTHSLVGIVDLAALFIFGPIMGAWVAASSGFFYLFLNAWRRDKHTLQNLVESPVFNAGLKIGMAYASSHIYTLLGGQFPAHSFALELAPAFLGASIAWFAVDHAGWALLEYLSGGAVALVGFLRTILFYSLVTELAPLPFSVVLAVVYTSLDRGTFVLLALGLLGTAIVVQRLADTSAHLERRHTELTVLNDFGQALSQVAFDPERIVALLCQNARRIAPADLIRVELYDPDHAPEGGTLVALEATPTETRRLDEIAPSSPLTEYFLSHREPIRALHVGKSQVYPADAARTALAVVEQVHMDGRPPRSGLYAPMLAGDQLIGVVALHARQANSFSATDERNLMSMASQAGVAIQNARLYVVERKRAAQLQAVSEISRQVAAVLDLDELFRQVVTCIRDQFGYTSVQLFTVDREAGYAVFRASTHPDSGEWRERGIRLRLGLEGIVGWVAAVGEPLLVNDVLKEPRYLPNPENVPNETRSELAVPLIVGKEVVGVLDVQSSTLNAFDDDDLFILRTVAAEVAIAIEDARLFNAQREEAWYLNVMLQVSQNLAATTDLDDALDTVVRITPLLVGVARCAVLLYNPADQVFSPGKAYGLSPEQQEAFRGFRLDPAEHVALAKVRRDLAPIVIQDPDADPLVGSEAQGLFGVHELLIAPLVTRGELVGAMVVDQGARARQFSEHEIEVVMGIANQAAVAIEGARLTSEAEAKRRYDYELGLARQIQQSFLPDSCPVLPGYELCSMWQTAREVGGDFYDFIPLSGGRWGIVIADVSDKGMAAALFMALSRTILRTMAIGKPTPHEAVDRANDVILSDARADMFVTLFFGVLEPSSGHFRYVNAGHNPPLLYRAARGEVTTLKGHGIALGVMPNVSMREHSIDLEPGDLLLLYTDGVTEEIDAREEEFGTERLASILSASGHLSAAGLIDEITQAVAEFAGHSTPMDDLTMVAIKRVASGEPGTSTLLTVTTEPVAGDGQPERPVSLGE